jgi:hypothetical protein
MINCKNCGVQIEENVNFCPLCGEAVEDEYSAESALPEIRRSKANRQPLTQFQRLTGFQKRKLIWEILGIILISGGLITIIIDLIDNAMITWSKYPAALCLVIFFNSTLAAFWHKRILLSFSASFVASYTLLIFLDQHAGDSGWHIIPGIPFLFMIYLVIFGFILLIRRLQHYGLNLIAYILLTIGLLCIGIDGIISLYIRQALHLGWSLIVMISVLPVAAFLLLVHSRLKKGTDLKRFFHI